MPNELMNKVPISKGQTLSARNGQYVIIKSAGVGKNNVVFYALGKDGPQRGSFCAIKVQYNLEGKRVKRFFREVSFLRQHEQSNIVKYYDEGYYQHANQTYPFVVMSYYPYTLEEYVESFKLSAEKKLSFACQLASALHWLYCQNVLHRDIKPQNILTDGENAILADFGLIKNINKERFLVSTDSSEIEDMLNASDTMPRYYRTPELVRFAKKEDILRIESDTFQMGLVFCFLFLGKNPLQPSETKLDTIVVDIPSSDGIDVTGFTTKSAQRIRNIINKMLDVNWESRVTPDAILEELISIYIDEQNSYLDN